MKPKLPTIVYSIIFALLCITTQITIAFESNQEAISIEEFQVSFPESYYERTNNDPLTILHPRSAIPIIQERGEEIIIQFQSISFDILSAEIETAYDLLPDTIELSIDTISQEENTYFARAIIPNDTPEELYNLTLTIESEGQQFSQTRPRSVSVKNEIDGNFTFIQIADFHIGDPRGLIENPKETIGWKAARRVIDEVNLLNPDFVIISGDLTFGQAYPFEYIGEYKKCYEILQDFQVPTFLCPGNHDGYLQTGQDGFKFWEKYFGPLYYSFDYDDSHFLSINSYDWSKIARFGISFLVFNWGGSVRSEQLKWIEQDLIQHQTKHQYMNLHHNPIWDTTSESLIGLGYHNREPLLNLIDTYDVEAVFAGHVHFDDVTIQNDTIFITTTTAASGLDGDGYWGYRLISMENNSIVSYNYKEPKYSLPSYHLNYSFTTDKSIDIENDLDQKISVLIEFVTLFDSYTVSNAEIIQVRQKEDMAAYYVSAIIDPLNETTIMLS
ncbi:hypothetical protein B6U98_05245 [Thermoplasmatales archaeon ex4572_165]|nr:MAG: hypothetical protein B6U98_05245 [Thermoplasmatales archaeon ex4572_165]